MRSLSIHPPQDAELLSLVHLPTGMRSWRNHRNGFVVLACHYSADPEKCSAEWYERATRNLRQDQVDREFELNFESRGGERAFGFLDQEVRVYKTPRIQYQDIPQNWILLGGLDFGGRNPTAILIFGVDERRRFHTIWEFYKPSSPKEVAQVLKNHPLYGRLRHIACDPSIWNKTQFHDLEGSTQVKSIAEMLDDLGIKKLIKGNNDRLAGLTRVKELFNYKIGNPKPYLLITEACPKLWWELTNLTYKVETINQLASKNLSEDTVKKDDHAFDALKYALLSWDIPADIARSRGSKMTITQLEEEIEERYDRMEEEFFF